MTRRTVFALTLSAAALIALAAGARPAAGTTGTIGSAATTGETRSIPAILTMTGSDSGVTQPKYHLAGSQDIFDQLWIEHLGDTPPRDAVGLVQTPQIDFGTVVAIFIFGGERVNTSGYTIDTVEHEDDAITVKYSAKTFQTSAIQGKDPGEPTRPWAMVLIPATGKTVYLMEQNLSMRPQAPNWTQRAVFPGRIGIGRPVGGTRQRGLETRQP
jgi:hypothetical protein